MVSGEDSVQHVRAIMERHSLSQLGVAELLGVSAGAVSNWLRGTRRPHPALREQIAYLYERESYCSRRVDACGATTSTGARNGVGWSEQEIATLVRLVRAGELTRAEIAEELGRAPGSVATKVRALRKGGVL